MNTPAQASQEAPARLSSTYQELIFDALADYLAGRGKGFNADQFTRVVTQRFTGIDRAKRRPTLEDIGSEFGISRERVRQLSQKFIFYFGEYLFKNGIQGHLDTVKRELTDQHYLFSFDAFAESVSKNLPGIQRSEYLDLLHYLRDIHEIYDLSDELASERKVLSYLIKDREATKLVRSIREVITKKDAHATSDIAAQVGIDDRLLDDVLEFASGFVVLGDQVFRKRGSLSALALGDVLYLIYKKENRTMHFSEVEKIVREVFEIETSESYVHNTLYADKRFVLVGPGKYALRDKNIVHGKTEELLMQYLRDKGSPAMIREFSEYLSTRRELTRGAITLAIYRCDDIIQVRRGWYGLRQWGGREMKFEKKDYSVKLRDGILSVLEDTPSPLTVEQIAEELERRYEGRCSTNPTSIFILLDNNDAEIPVHKDLSNRYFLTSRMS